MKAPLTQKKERKEGRKVGLRGRRKGGGGEGGGANWAPDDAVCEGWGGGGQGYAKASWATFSMMIPRSAAAAATAGSLSPLSRSICVLTIVVTKFCRAAAAAAAA